MLIVVCGMLRSGSTLQYQAACALVEAAGLADPATNSAGLGWDWPSVDRQHATSPNWYVLKVHDPSPAVEATLDPKSVWYLYSYRDIRDVAASWIAKEKLDVAKPAPDTLNFVAPALQAYSHFASRQRVLITRYEALIADLRAGVISMRDFLGLPVGDEACAAIARSLAFDSQRGRLNQIAWREGQQWDESSLLHRNHLRDGAVGKWKTELPGSYVQYIESLAGSWLDARGYTPASAA